MQVQQLLVARVGDLLIGIPSAEIVQVLPMLPLWRPPTLPRPVSGFVAMHGAALPVLDARALFGEASAAPSLYSHILELRTAGRQGAGLLVDRAEGFATPATIGEIGAERSLNGCAVAIFHHGDAGLAYLLAADRLLDQAEQEALSALTEEADRRRAEWQVAA